MLFFFYLLLIFFNIIFNLCGNLDITLTATEDSSTNVHEVIHLSSLSLNQKPLFPCDIDLQNSSCLMGKNDTSEDKRQPLDVQNFDDKNLTDINQVNTEEVIDLNFENTTISSLIKILADKMGFAYILSKDLESVKVPPLKSFGPRKISQAWNLILNLLRDSGFSHEDRGGLHIFSKDGQLYPFYSSKEVPPDKIPDDSDQVIRYLYYLNNLRADAINSFLGNFLTEKPIQVGSLDVLLLKEKARNLKKILQIVQELDIGGVHQTVVILPLKYTNADTVARFLNDDIIAQSKNNSGDKIRFFSPNKKSVTYFPTEVRVIPYKDKDVIIFFGQKAEIDRLIHFVKLAIDIKLPGANSRIHIKEVKNQAPDYVKGIIERLISSRTSQVGGNPDRFKDVVLFAETPGQQRSSSGSRIIVSCSNEEWRIIEDLIEDLDKATQTIAIEIMIVDASMSLLKILESHIRDRAGGFINQNVSFRTNNFANSLDFQGTPREYPINGGILNYQDASDFAFGKTTAGVLDQDAWGLIRTVATQHNSAVLYQPFITVKSNETGRWSQSDRRQVPGEIQSTASKVTRRQAQVSATTAIDITPRVNLGGQVDIDLTITVEEFLATTLSPDTPESSSRTVKTTATIGMGEVLALGGFDRSKLSKQTANTPILGNIPIIGTFFKSATKQSDKTQTMFFIRASTMKQELQPEIDDYTALKVKYAKYQLGNIDNYAETKDPFVRFFFKPRKSTIKQTVSDYQQGRFKYIDDFIERKTMPQSANIKNDPSFNSGIENQVPNKAVTYWDKIEKYNTDPEKTLKKKKSKKNQTLIIEENISVLDSL